jgi:hypothetical protein
VWCSNFTPTVATPTTLGELLKGKSFDARKYPPALINGIDGGGITWYGCDANGVLSDNDSINLVFNNDDDYTITKAGTVATVFPHVCLLNLANASYYVFGHHLYINVGTYKIEKKSSNLAG